MSRPTWVEIALRTSGRLKRTISRCSAGCSSASVSYFRSFMRRLSCGVGGSDEEIVVLAERRRGEAIGRARAVEFERQADERQVEVGRLLQDAERLGLRARRRPGRRSRSARPGRRPRRAARATRRSAARGKSPPASGSARGGSPRASNWWRSADRRKLRPLERAAQCAEQIVVAGRHHDVAVARSGTPDAARSR